MLIRKEHKTLTQMLLANADAIDRREKFTYAYEDLMSLMQARLIEIHPFRKIKVGYFNRVVSLFDLRLKISERMQNTIIPPTNFLN